MKQELKTNTCYYQDIIDGNKKFEVRKNDRSFRVGDVLRLREYEPKTKEYTGRYCYARVDYVLSDFPAIKAGYVVMSIRLIL